MAEKSISLVYFLFALVLLGLSACSTDSKVGLQTHSPPANSVVDGLLEDAQSPAALLITEAESLRKQGKLDLAASKLERGIRAWPSEAATWYLLAVVRSNQGQWQQTENLARKSIDKANGRARLLMKNWWLISLSRESRGDKQGALNARQRALDLIGEK